MYSGFGSKEVKKEVRPGEKQNFIGPNGNLVEVFCHPTDRETVLIEREPVGTKSRSLGEVLVGKSPEPIYDKEGEVVVLKSGEEHWVNAGVLDWSYLLVTHRAKRNKR